MPDVCRVTTFVVPNGLNERYVIYEEIFTLDDDYRLWIMNITRYWYEKTVVDRTFHLNLEREKMDNNITVDVFLFNLRTF